MYLKDLSELTIRMQTELLLLMYRALVSRMISAETVRFYRKHTEHVV